MLFVVQERAAVCASHPLLVPAHRCCEYAGLVLDERPHVPLDRLCVKVGLEAVLGKPRPRNHQALDNTPVDVPHDSREHLHTQQQAASSTAEQLHSVGAGHGTAALQDTL